MNWLEVVMLVFGVGAFAGSFMIRDKSSEDGEGQHVDVELIRDVIEKEMKDAKERVTEVVDETLEYAVEKTERASERISNEKIMAINEYSETVLADINKSHQEVMFLYDMLNDKHNNLKETVKHVDRTAKEAEEAANAAALALAAKAQEEAETKEKEKQEEEKKKKAAKNMLMDKDAQEKEYARRQMARLILPMQQELTMHRQMDPRALGMKSLVANPVNKQPSEKPAELSPLVVKSVEIVSADIVSSNDMQPVVGSTGIEPVSMADLQTLGSRPENMKVVDVKPADIRPVEVYSFVEQAPHIERPVKKETQAAGINTGNQQDGYAASQPVDDFKENNNDRILRLHKEGYSNVEIAKELGLGVGEVKLVINLFKGAV
ncbi:MAG: helix-turn-helix domain-containing protein [Lachnospiraceae bacterium]|nr:helix-turn-helix domain-containing protein [Lachnospiraceae bacterium]